MNAVNQCVGRVVRHAKDYAAVVLVWVVVWVARLVGENEGSERQTHEI